MTRSLTCALTILLVTASSANTGQTGGEAVSLPKLDGKSGKGLKIECRLLKTKFVVGEPVNMWCTIKNTTDSIKPIGWHPKVGAYFLCLHNDHDKPRKWGGLMPKAYPQIDTPIMIKSNEMRPDYILFLPPGKSIQILLTFKLHEPEKFKGRIVYDPVAPRSDGIGIFMSKDDHPPWRHELVFSNEFEYEVVAEHSANIKNMKDMDPLDFLSHLQKTPESTCTVMGVPRVWVKDDHLSKLFELLDSEEKCASVINAIASSDVGMGKPTTVGREAGFLIRSFRTQRYPAGPGSTMSETDKEELRKWWRRYQKESD